MVTCVNYYQMIKLNYINQARILLGRRIKESVEKEVRKPDDNEISGAKSPRGPIFVACATTKCRSVQTKTLSGRSYWKMGVRSIPSGERNQVLILHVNKRGDQDKSKKFDSKK